MMRQRLVGALVLLCLGVIVWSVLFTGSVDHRVDRDTQIPQAPKIDPVLERSPQQPEGIPSVAGGQLPPQPTLPPMDEEGEDREDGQGVRAAAEPPPPAEEDAPSSAPPSGASTERTPVAASKAGDEQSKPPSEPGLDQRGLPNSWVVQVGSFGSKANADTLVKKLRSRGYKAFEDEFRSGGRLLYRVQVGPVLDEARARALKTEIDQRFGVKSIVNRFEG